jgi:hypothetical protein
MRDKGSTARVANIIEAASRLPAPSVTRLFEELAAHTGRVNAKKIAIITEQNVPIAMLRFLHLDSIGSIFSGIRFVWIDCRLGEKILFECARDFCLVA